MSVIEVLPDFPLSPSPEDLPNYRMSYQVEKTTNVLLARAKWELEDRVVALQRELDQEKERYCVATVYENDEGKLNNFLYSF
jgi:hypothetical protein